MRKRALLGNEGGAAAVEMALVIPLVLTIMMGCAEVANYFLDEHILVKGVRDGALYAARQDISNYDCSSGTPTVPATVVANTKALVRTGQLAAGTDRLANWTANGTSFTMSVACYSAAGGTSLTGIFASSPTGKAPVVTVTAQLPYAPILQSFGFRGTGYNLNASQQAVVSAI